MKKSLTLLVLMSCLSLLTKAQGLPLVEDFDGETFPPTGWTQQQFAGEQSWTKGTNPVMMIGSGAAYAMISQASTTALISPAVDIPSGVQARLTFQTKFMYPDLTAKYEVWISNTTSDDAGAFTVLKSLRGDDEISGSEWKEISVILPDECSGGSVYVAFVTSCTAAGFYAWAVDEVELAEVTDDPVFRGDETLDVGAVYNNLPFPTVKGYAVANKGGSALQITSVSSATDGLSVSNLPLSIAPGSTDTLDVTLDARSLPAGAYAGDFTLATNDPDRQQVTVNLTAEVHEAVICDYVDESFDASMQLPDSWTVNPASGAYAFAVKSGRGISGSNCLTVEVYNASQTASVKTAYVDMGAAPRLAFSYKLTDWTFSGTGTPTSADKVSMSVNISCDGGATWDEVHAMPAGQHTPSADFASVEIPLDDYADGICMVEIEFQQAATGADFYVDIDNVSVGTPPDIDLAAVSLAGNAIPTVGVTSAYTARVRNAGLKTVQEYSVALLDGTGIQVATKQGKDIAPGETQEIAFDYTPGSTGAAELYFRIDATGDKRPANNESNHLQLTVQPEWITPVAIGDGAALIDAPVNFSQAESLAQTLYLPNEIGTDGGTITGLVYKTRMTASHAGEAIKVWMGETDKTDYADYQRVNPDSLTLVFDGTVDFNSTDGGEVVVSLDTPFEYGGRTLVIYTYRPRSAAYSSEDLFYGTETTGYRTFSTGYLFTQVDPMDPYVAMTPYYHVPDVTLLTDLTATGSLVCTVTDGSSSVADAEVRLMDGNLTTTTDDEGRFEFPHLTSGSHKIEISKYGHLATTIEANITAGQTTRLNATLPLVVGYPVTGRITGSDTDGNGILGAIVALRGYENYSAVADSNGDFTFPDVYEGDYQILVSAGGYETYAGEVAVSDAVVKDIALVATPFPVREVRTEVTDGEMSVSWDAPEAVTQFRYDSGTPDSQTGFGGGTSYGIFGSVHHVGATLSGVSWYLSDWGGLQEAVNLYVFALGTDGRPTNEILFEATGVATDVNCWNSYEFPAPVEAPTGFYVALGRESGFLSLGVSEPTEDYPFVAGTQFYSGDYRTSTFIAVEETAADGTQGQMVNYMIRAEGVSHGEIIVPGQPAEMTQPRVPSPASYTVHRLVDGTDESQWVEVASGLTQCQVSDDWHSLEDGTIYRYAVTATYPAGNTSAATFSEALPKGMEVAFTVNISTDTGESPQGAVVAMESADDARRAYSATADGTSVTFPAVWRGRYNITVEKEHFDKVSLSDVAIDDEGLSVDVVLTESIVAPYGLDVKVAGSNATLTWNNAPTTFFDDMEGHEDFAISDIGGYTLRDGDGQPTYFFNDIHYDNMGYVGSFIVMNPSMTTPEANSDPFLPYSGDRYLACFCTRTATANDDWLILPRLRMTQSSQLSFYAQNFTVGYDIARFKVGVSTSGTEPEDFTIISDGAYELAPYGEQGLRASWDKLTYDLGDFAGQEVYIAIACVSDDMTSAFMLDDIAVTGGTEASGSLAPQTPQQETGRVSYNIFLDGTQQAAGITGQTYDFTGLTSGVHTAGVQAVYASGASDVVSIEFTVTDDSGIDEAGKTAADAWFDDRADALHVSPSASGAVVAIYDLNGRLIVTSRADGGIVDCSALAPGCYIARINKTDGLGIVKFVKD